jgi:hypothetical protein
MSSKTKISKSQGVSSCAQSASTNSSLSQLRCLLDTTHIWAGDPSTAFPFVQRLVGVASHSEEKGAQTVNCQLFKLARIGLWTLVSWQICLPVHAGSIPVDTDIPEEVLRAEIITEARSPIDGKALSANDFAELVIATKRQIELEDANIAADSPKLKETIILLRLRSFLRSVGVPIK